MVIDQDYDEEYYIARMEMFCEKGWKDLIEDIELIIKSTNSLNGVNDEKTLQFRKGELSILNWIVGLETMSREAYDGLKVK